MSSFTLPHILGVAFGLGIATALDFLLIKNIFYRRTFRESQYKVIMQLSKIIAFGLLLLWISGLGFLWVYQYESPEKLLNPKIWSKLMIVTVLTMNGFFIHYYVLPRLKKCVNKRIDLECSYKELTIIFTCGAVSVVSWYMPFIYGTVPQLNFAFSFTVFTLAYITIVGLAVLCALNLLNYIYDFDLETGKPTAYIGYIDNPQLKNDFSDAFSNMVKVIRAQRGYRQQPLKLLDATGHNGGATLQS